MNKKIRLLSTLVVLSLLAGCSENTAKPTETNTQTESTEKTTTTALALHNYEDTNVNFETIFAYNTRSLNS